MESGKNFKENNLRVIQNYFGSNTPEKLHIDNITYDGDDHLITYTEIDIPGDSLLEQMDYMEESMDNIRLQLLGDDPTNCSDLIVPPKDPRAVAGYIIMETMGYPPFSGSNTLAAGYSLLQNGFVEQKDGKHSFYIECAAGLSEITYESINGEIKMISITGQDVYLAHDGLELTICGKQVKVPVVYSGGFYLMIPSKEIPTELKQENYDEFIKIGKKSVDDARALYYPKHLTVGDVGPIPFANFMEDKQEAGHYVGATFVYPDCICYCPTGTGSSAHTLMRYVAGEVKVGDRVEVQSPIGSTMYIDILGADKLEDRPRLQVRINGLPTPKEVGIQAIA
ncbi:MAG: proline racemase family protein [Desulfuromusa sp.]|jgi:proline racemase|nr:proline racemase family protein [Desulfuromusa sp.]